MVRISNIPSRKRDRNVVLPDAAKAAIKRGRSAYNKAKRKSRKTCRYKKSKLSPAIVSVIDPKDQKRRESRLEAKIQAAGGRRGQPPMTDRLRVVAIHVDHLERNGVRFATARDSRMNKAVRERLNSQMAMTNDDRKSRRGTIGPDAVTDLLKQVQELRRK